MFVISLTVPPRVESTLYGFVFFLITFLQTQILASFITDVYCHMYPLGVPFNNQMIYGTWNPGFSILSLLWVYQ